MRSHSELLAFLSLSERFKARLAKLGYDESQVIAISTFQPPRVMFFIDSHEVLSQIFTKGALIQMLKEDVLETIFHRLDDLKKIMDIQTLSGMNRRHHCHFLKMIADNFDVVEKMCRADARFKMELPTANQYWLRDKILQFPQKMILEAVINNKLSDLQMRYVTNELARIVKQVRHQLILDNGNEMQVLSMFSHLLVARHYAGISDSRFAALMDNLSIEKLNLLTEIEEQIPADLMEDYSTYFNVAAIWVPHRRNTSKRQSAPQENNSEASNAMDHTHKKPKSTNENVLSTQLRLPQQTDAEIHPANASNKNEALRSKQDIRQYSSIEAFHSHLSSLVTTCVEFIKATEGNPQLKEDMKKLSEYLSVLAKEYVNVTPTSGVFKKSLHAKLSQFASQKQGRKSHLTVMNFIAALNEIKEDQDFSRMFFPRLVKKMRKENVKISLPFTLTLGNDNRSHRNTDLSSESARVEADNGLLALGSSGNLDFQTSYALAFDDENNATDDSRGHSESACLHLSTSTTDSEVSVSANPSPVFNFAFGDEIDNTPPSRALHSDIVSTNTPHSFFHMALEPLLPVFQQPLSDQVLSDHAFNIDANNPPLAADDPFALSFINSPTL